MSQVRSRQPPRVKCIRIASSMAGQGTMLQEGMSHPVCVARTCMIECRAEKEGCSRCTRNGRWVVPAGAPGRG